MKDHVHIETCPQCGETLAVRRKLILIDEAWAPGPGKDPREAYFSSLRVDDLKKEHLQPEPLEQFVEGYLCDKCERGFVSETAANETRRHYYR